MEQLPPLCTAEHTGSCSRLGFQSTAAVTLLIGDQHIVRVFTASNRSLQGASDEAIEAELAASPDDPQPLTDEEVAERDRLLEVHTPPACWLASRLHCWSQGVSQSTHLRLLADPKP